MAKKLNKSSAESSEIKNDASTKDSQAMSLDDLVYSRLSRDLKKVAILGKLKKKARSQEELKALMKEKDFSQEEIDQSLAFHELVLEHKETFSQILEEEKKPDKVRTAGHFFDNKLKYSLPLKEDQQMTIFDLLSKPETKQKIAKVDYAVNAVGITLNASENKLMTAITKLLQDKSENQDSSSENFYLGNDKPVPMHNYGGTGESMRAPVLKFKPAELYKAYLDSTQYSGQDIKYIKRLLESLAQKKFVIHYERRKIVEKNGKEQRLTDVIEDFQPLIRILKYIPDLTDEELDELKKKGSEVVEKRGEYLLSINPVLVDQIGTKYVEYPRDIERRTALAAGGHNKLANSDVILRDYMLRELSAKRYQCEINREKLSYILKLDYYMRNRKKKKAYELISKAIEVSIQLGLILSVENEIGKKGQAKFIFHLNPNYC